MINETYLRHSVKDLQNEINVYVYNNKFVDIILNRYYEDDFYKKTKKEINIQKCNGYFILSTKNNFKK